MSTLRAAVVRASMPAMTRLNELPRLVPVAAVLALLLIGLALPWGWIALVALALFLSWVLYLAWPQLSGLERLMRVAVLVLLVAVTLTRIVPRG